jgi:hypothetical protein
MTEPLDAKTLSLLFYETTMLCCTGRYLVPRQQASPSHIPNDIYNVRSPPNPCCGSTLSANLLAPYLHSTISASPGPTDPVVRNALIESFLVHYRILAEFLCNTKRSHPDQILAKDFARDPPAVIGTNVPHNLDLCHQRLAHLSRDRAEQKQSWDWEQMYKEILNVLIEFIRKCACNIDDQAKRDYLAILGLRPSLI